jgi:hypothetical protein
LPTYSKGHAQKMSVAFPLYQIVRLRSAPSLAGGPLLSRPFNRRVSHPSTALRTGFLASFVRSGAFQSSRAIHLHRGLRIGSWVSLILQREGCGSHPFGSAQGRLFRKGCERWGTPLGCGRSGKFKGVGQECPTHTENADPRGPFDFPLGFARGFGKNE